MVRACLGYPGYRCPRLVKGGNRCADCQRAVYRIRDLERPPGERAFYGSAAWKSLATAAVEAADACATCGTPKAYTRLTGGHRIPIRQRPDLALEASNVIPQCIPCQSLMKRRPDPATWSEYERSPRIPRGVGS
jgi:ribosomal protein S14